MHLFPDYDPDITQTVEDMDKALNVSQAFQIMIYISYYSESI